MKSEWNKLDNAAKIFPAAQSKKDTQVFQIFLRIIQNSKQRPFAKSH